jgi:hypothetical protein
MKFLVQNYSCLQNPWLGGYQPQIPVLSVLCPQLNLLNPPLRKNSWVRHWFTFHNCITMHGTENIKLIILIHIMRNFMVLYPRQIKLCQKPNLLRSQKGRHIKLAFVQAPSQLRAPMRVYNKVQLWYSRTWAVDEPQVNFQYVTYIFSALIGIKCIKNQRNTLNYNDVFLLWYFHLHVSASNPAIFRVTFLLQEYGVTKCVKLFHIIEIHRLLVRIFCRITVRNDTKLKKIK